MTDWICATCAVEYPDTDQPPTICPICSDDRQYVRPSGQRWTTLTELTEAGHRGSVSEVEPGLLGITISPSVGIGQRALLVQTPSGNLLWDSTGYVDDDLAEQVAAAGGVAAVAASHPHMFGVQTAWSRRFGDAPVYVAEADAAWVQRQEPVITTWDEPIEVIPGVTLHRIGGHFPGSAVAHFLGADGRGVLLSGDTVAGTPDDHWVSFMRSFPNKVPLSAAVVEKVASRVLTLDFDRLYDNFGARVASDAADMGPSVGGPLHRLGARRLRPPHRLAQIEVAFVCPEPLERLRAHHSYRTVTRSSATPEPRPADTRTSSPRAVRTRVASTRSPSRRTERISEFCGTTSDCKARPIATRGHVRVTTTPSPMPGAPSRKPANDLVEFRPCERHPVADFSQIASEQAPVHHIAPVSTPRQIPTG